MQFNDAKRSCCLHTYVYMYLVVHISTCTCILLSTYVHVSRCLHTYVYMYRIVYISTCTYILLCAWVRTYLSSHVYIWLHICFGMRDAHALEGTVPEYSLTTLSALTHGIHTLLR
jgi:hypothetical protein